MYKKGAMAIIRPRRATYNHRNVPTIFNIPNFGEIERTSIAFRNCQGDVLYGSFYQAPRPYKNNCVIYLHGNASNQLEGRYMVSLFLPVGISVFCFDFSGCGCSSGKYVSLGYREPADVAAAVQLLREDFGVQEIALWGRSMGAAVSLLALTNDDLRICAAVADSAYTSIIDLVSQLANRPAIPTWFSKKAIKKVKKIIQKKANFDIQDVRPIDACSTCTKPVFFIHGEEDTFVLKSNTEDLFNCCQSEKKQMHIVPGKHNSDRPGTVIMKATEFLCRELGLVISFDQPVAMTEQKAEQHFSGVDELLNNV